MDTLFKPFDIRDYLAQLEPTKHKSKYECPVCAGHNLSVNPRTGAYQCWNGCETQDIRTAIAPRQPYAHWDIWERRRLEKQAERKQRQQQKAAKLAQSLSIPERDRQIRKVLAQLSLSDGDRLYLENRGIPPQIIAHCHTVQKHQPLTNYVIPQLPGVNQWGSRLTNSWEGILVPFCNAEGLFVGMRLHDPNAQITGNGKYVWLSSDWLPQGFGPQLPNGELPLAVHYPSTLTDPTKIGLCEGPEWKAAVAADRLGFPVIGFSGNNFISSPETLKVTLATIKAKLGIEKVTLILIPDAGVGRNSGIAKNHANTIQLIESWEEDILTAWWGQESKQAREPGSYRHLDIDEIPLSALTQIEYKTIDFQNLKYYGQNWENWRKSHKITVKRTQIDQEFLNTQLFRPGIAHGIRSGMGTGKTVSLIKELRANHKTTGVNITGYRNSLLYNTCAKASQPSPLLAYDFHNKTMHHLNHHPETLFEDQSLWFVNCLDSFEKIPAWLDEAHTCHYFDDKYMVIDEAEAVCLHALCSRTLKGKAVRILQAFKLALKRCLGVVFLDANLSDWVLELLGYWSGKPLEITHNTHQKNKAKLTLLEGTFDLTQQDAKVRKGDRSPWLLDMLAHQCFAVAADGQKFIESLEQWLITHGISPARILRIDGKTTPTKEIKEFLQNPDQWLANHPNTILLYTTSAESGLDIAIENYFNCLYGFYLGVVRVNAFCQLLGRIRDQVERKVWIRPYPFKFTTQDQFLSFNAEYIAHCQQQALILQANLTLEDPALVNQYLANSLNHPDFQHELKLVHQLTALRNYEQSNLRECTEYRLQALGYQLHKLCPDKTVEHTNANKTLKNLSEAVEWQNCHDIATADSSFIGKPLSQLSHDATWEERCAKEKAQWFERLPHFWGDEVKHPDGYIESLYTMDKTILHLLKYEQPHLVRGRELLYLSRHLDQARLLTQSQIAKTLEGQGILPWQISTQYLKARALNYLGIEELMEVYLREGSLSADMPIVQNLMKKAKGQLTVQRGKLNVAIALGKKIPQSPGRLIVYLFNLVGIPSQLSGKDYDKVKILTRQWESLMENDLLSRLDTAISHRFSHLCRQIQKGDLQAILAPCSPDHLISPKPRQDKGEEVVKKSLLSLGNLDQLVQHSDPAISPELLTMDNEPAISGETPEIDLEGNDYDLNMKWPQ
jgi:hypothetical protein